MSVRLRRVARAGVRDMVTALSAWQPNDCYVEGPHAGDVGWQLSRDDDVVAATLVVVDDESGIVAAGIIDRPGLLRVTIRPDRVYDLSVASALADAACGLSTPRSVEAPAGSALRSVLSDRGWYADRDLWAMLYRRLGPDDAARTDPASRVLMTDDDIAGRVAVQRSAFPASTFTVPRWHQMVAGPGYDASFDLLRRTPEGIPAAVATGWSAEPGKCGILEPVGTRPNTPVTGRVGRCRSL